MTQLYHNWCSSSVRLLLDLHGLRTVDRLAVHGLKGYIYRSMDWSICLLSIHRSIDPLIDRSIDPSIHLYTRQCISRHWCRDSLGVWFLEVRDLPIEGKPPSNLTYGNSGDPLHPGVDAWGKERLWVVCPITFRKKLEPPLLFGMSISTNNCLLCSWQGWHAQNEMSSAFRCQSFELGWHEKHVRTFHLREAPFGTKNVDRFRSVFAISHYCIVRFSSNQPMS